MIRICHVITTIEMGGAEKQLLELVGQQVLLGDEVQIVFLKGRPQLAKRLELSGAVVHSDISNKHFLQQYFKFKQLIRSIAPNIIHAHLPRSEVLVRITSADTPFIVTRHNSEKFFPSAYKRISSYLSRYVLRRALFCICISEGVRNFLYQFHEISNRTQVKVVHYGIQLLNNRESSRSQSDVKVNHKSSFDILCVARLVPQKNLDILLEAFSKLVDLDSRTNLTIVGRGYLGQTLKDLSASLGVASRIEWIEECEEIDELMTKFDCLVLPSKYEGFGLVLLEAMRSNLPVIASNIPTSIEILGSEYFGLFESNSSLSLCLKLQEFMKSEIQIASTNWQNFRLRKFDITKTSREIRDIYVRAINLGRIN